MKHGDFALATRLYTDAIILDPANHVLYSNRSAAHLRLNQWDEALYDARKCKQMKPDWSKVRFVLKVWFRRKDIQQSRNDRKWGMVQVQDLICFGQFIWSALVLTFTQSTLSSVCIASLTYSSFYLYIYLHYLCDCFTNLHDYPACHPYIPSICWSIQVCIHIAVWPCALQIFIVTIHPSIHTSYPSFRCFCSMFLFHLSVWLCHAFSW